MFKLFRKCHLSVVFALLIFSSMSSLAANECCSSCGCNRLYIGGFGGELFSNRPEIRLSGTVFIFGTIVNTALAVDARGPSCKTSPGFGGAQLGYEWTQCPFYIGCSNWALTPAFEAEALFYSETRKGELIDNLHDRTEEHDFQHSFDVNAGVYIGNAVFTLRSCCLGFLGRFAPYVGIGVGAAHLSARKANALERSEPGVNHFNSKRNHSDWTLAVQAKGGVQYCFCKYLSLFAEYRFLSIDPSHYTFGSTVDTTHGATTPWSVDMAHILYNGFSLGIQFNL